MTRTLYSYGYDRLSVRGIARRAKLDHRKLGPLLKNGMAAEDAVEYLTSCAPTPREARTYLVRGEWVTIREAMTLTGLCKTTLYRRISGDRILEREEMTDPHCPGRVDAALITFKGETHTVTEWAEIVGIPRETIFSRLFNGWSADRALSTTPQQRGRGSPKARNRRIITRMTIGFRRIRNHQIISRISSATRPQHREMTV